MPDATEAVTAAQQLSPVAPLAALSVMVPEEVSNVYQELERQVLALRPTEDLEPMRKAFQFACERHRNQKRASGEPFMSHPLQVTQILVGMNMDMICLQ